MPSSDSGDDAQRGSRARSAGGSGGDDDPLDPSSLPALFWDEMPDNPDEHPDYMALQASLGRPGLLACLLLSLLAALENCATHGLCLQCRKHARRNAQAVHWSHMGANAGDCGRVHTRGARRELQGSGDGMLSRARRPCSFPLLCCAAGSLANTMLQMDAVR